MVTFCPKGILLVCCKVMLPLEHIVESNLIFEYPSEAAVRSDSHAVKESIFSEKQKPLRGETNAGVAGN